MQDSSASGPEPTPTTTPSSSLHPPHDYMNHLHSRPSSSHREHRHSHPHPHPHPHSHPHSHLHNKPIEVVFKNISVSIHVKSKPSPFSFPPSLKSKGTETASIPNPETDLVEKRILEDISGYAKPGQMLGVMGPSGSGKTTLLSCLSGRLKPDRGCIQLNGEALNKQLRRKICYVLQQDIFFPDLTLRQTLVYTALLRLPDSISYEQKLRHVDHIIDVLDLRQCQHTIIGDMLKRGLSGGEKKRANIACELLTNPTVMLIDEPTSGLDSSTAHHLMQTLKDYAVKERKTMIATVHQPSSQIFHMFDKLMLLCGGRVAFFGDIDDVVPFFSTIGYQISPHFNPADFVMEKVKGIPSEQERIIVAAQSLDKTPECPKPLPEVSRVDQSSYEIEPEADPKSTDSESQETETNPLWPHHEDHQEQDNHQTDLKGIEIRVVIDPCCKKIQKVYSKIVNDDDSGRSSWTETDRSSTSTFSSNSSSSSTSSSEEMFFNFSKTKESSSYCSSSSTSSSDSGSDQKWATSFYTQLSVLTQRNFFEARGRMLSKLNWIQTIGLAIVTGLIWFQVDRTEATLTDIRGWMFYSTTYWMLFALFGALISFPPEREVINKERASGAYRLSSYYIAKMVGELPLTVCLPTVFHLISYPLLGYNNFSTFLLLWVFLILSTVVAQSVGLFIGAACVDLEVSVTISALYSMSTMLFAGFYSSTMPSWLSWLRYASMVYYAFNNMQMVEFNDGPPILCSSTNSKFASCHSPTNISSLASPQFIPYSELVLQMDNMNPGSEPLPLWVNTLVLVLFLVIFRLLGYLVLRYLRKPK